MRIVCWQTILVKYHNVFRKLRESLSFAAVVIGALRVRCRGRGGGEKYILNRTGQNMCFNDVDLTVS